MPQDCELCCGKNWLILTYGFLIKPVEMLLHPTPTILHNTNEVHTHSKQWAVEQQHYQTWLFSVVPLKGYVVIQKDFDLSVITVRTSKYWLCLPVTSVDTRKPTHFLHIFMIKSYITQLKNKKRQIHWPCTLSPDWNARPFFFFFYLHSFQPKLHRAAQNPGPADSLPTLKSEIG